MGEGEATRDGILEHATALASQVGLHGLTIGRLASDLELSKSGLFAHFRSKEALQVKVLEHAARRFVELVVKPTLATRRGEPRLRALFEHWRSWPRKSGMAGGCFFVQASVELDDQPGPARDLLVRQQREWLDTIATVTRSGIEEGQFSGHLDPAQVAQELYGIMLAWHHASRLLRDGKADARARAAFEALLQRLKG